MIHEAAATLTSQTFITCNLYKLLGQRVSIDLKQLTIPLEPGVEYSFRVNAGLFKDWASIDENLPFDFVTYTTNPIIITGTLSEYKANVQTITLDFSEAVYYNAGSINLYDSLNTLIQTWTGAELSLVDGTNQLVLNITDPLANLARYSDYYVTLDNNLFIGENRVYSKANSWPAAATQFNFNTGDHDLLPFASLVASLGTMTSALTYNFAGLTSNPVVVSTQNTLAGHLRQPVVSIQTVSSISCSITPASSFPEFLYYDHNYDEANDWIVFDAANTTAQNLDVLAKINGYSGYTYTLTVTPSNTAFVTTLSSTSTLGSASFDNISKVLTVVGSDSDISDNLDKLQITLSGLEGNFDIVYNITNNIDQSQEFKTIKIYNVVYPTFTSFEFYSGDPMSNVDRYNPRSKSQLYSEYDSNTYPWINNNWFLDANNGIYRWRVPQSGSYLVWAKGGGINSALMKSNFYLEKDDEIEILIGLTGATKATSGNRSAPGSGGTFLVKKKTVFGTWGIKQQVDPTVDDILVIAGGQGSGDTALAYATTNATPNPGYISQGAYGNTSSSSGTITFSNQLQDGITYNGTAQGGAGFVTDSGNADSYLNGGLGGLLNYGSGQGQGGFGGGGAAIGKLKTNDTTKYCGGGGGYAGGGAAIYIGDVISPAYATGGGGSSYSNSYNMGGNTDQRWSPYYTNTDKYPHPFSYVDINGSNGFVAIIKE